MKLLFVLPEYIPHSGGGISTYYKELIPALVPHCKSIKVMVGSGYAQGGVDFSKNGIEVTYLKKDLFKTYISKFSKFSIFPNVQKNIAAAWAMWEQLKHEDFDAVECTDFGLGFLPWIIQQKIPVKVQLHGSGGQIGYFDPQADEMLENDFLKHVELSILQHAAVLQSHSSANTHFWQPFFKTDITTLLPIYQDITPSVKFNLRSGRGLVCGRIQYWKGPTITCEAASLLINKQIGIDWIGRDMKYLDLNNSMNDWLKNRYPNTWLKNVMPIGTVSHSDIRIMQKYAYFGLVPSVWDMFNFCCVEFMAAGTLAICSNGAGASELIENGINGFSYSNNDPKELADILCKVAKLDEIGYAKLAKNGQETISNKLSAASLAATYMTVFSNVIDNFKGKALNEFIANSYLPEDKNYPINYTLDKLPLKDLMRYNIARLKNKFYKIK